MKYGDDRFKYVVVSLSAASDSDCLKPVGIGADDALSSLAPHSRDALRACLVGTGRDARATVGPIGTRA